MPSQPPTLEIGEDMQVIQQEVPLGVRAKKRARKAPNRSLLLIDQDKLVAGNGFRQARTPQHAAILGQGTLQEIVAQNPTVGTLPATSVQPRNCVGVRDFRYANRHGAS